MPDATLQEALKEAYASAPVDEVIINTLSIWFDGLVDDNGAETELFVFQGYGGTRREDGLFERDLPLEADAPRQPGQTVSFIGMPFDITLPDVSTNQMAKGQLKIDGVSREITTALTAAVELNQPVEMTYRPYLTGHESEGPQARPIKFGLANVSATATLVTGDIVLRHFGDRRFPWEIYDLERFKALVR